MMSARGLFLWLGLAAGAASAACAAEREFKQTFAVQPGCTLKIDSYRGAIMVVEGDVSNEIQVSLHMEIGADSEKDADEFRAALQLEAGLANNTVTLRARNPRETRVRFVWNDKNQMELAWKITVPRECHVDASVLNGTISIGNLAGRIAVKTEKGAISIKNIDGTIDASAQFGDVVISRCSGAVKVRVLQGLIRVGTMFGFADLKNTTGDVEVMTAHRGVTASAEAGDVIVGFPRTMAGDSRLTSSGGSIRAKIDPAANCSIDAASVWGRVESQLPLEIGSGASGKRTIVGRLGQGGPAITLRANGGQVRLVPGDTPFD